MVDHLGGGHSEGERRDRHRVSGQHRDLVVEPVVVEPGGPELDPQSIGLGLEAVRVPRHERRSRRPSARYEDVHAEAGDSARVAVMSACSRSGVR